MSSPEVSDSDFHFKDAATPPVSPRRSPSGSALFSPAMRSLSCSQEAFMAPRSLSELRSSKELKKSPLSKSADALLFLQRQTVQDAPAAPTVQASSPSFSFAAAPETLPAKPAKQINPEDRPYIDRFLQLKLKTPAEIPQAAHDKNRYPNVFPGKEERVTLEHKLKGEDGYIHANKFGRMILTQAPFIRSPVTTVGDFWLMAFENASTIVCLTDHMGMEEGRLVEKTFPYWNPSLAQPTPAGSDPQLVYEKKLILENDQELLLRVRLIDEERTVLSSSDCQDAVSQRIFEITLGEGVKRVMHLHYKHWPDHGICNPKMLAQFIALLRELTGTIIAHCSAGIGRTGTFAASYSCIDQYVDTEVLPTDPETDETVLAVRKVKPGSVQNFKQLRSISDTCMAFSELPKK